MATPERGAAALERPQGGAEPALFDDGVTLEGKILRVWEDLVVEGRAACPVCGGSMAPATGCATCGSELS